MFKAGAAYLALGWVVVQITTTLVPALNLPSSLIPIVTWIGVIGFPFVIMFSWVYELTPEGLKREHEVDRKPVDHRVHRTTARPDYHRTRYRRGRAGAAGSFRDSASSGRERSRAG